MNDQETPTEKSKAQLFAECLQTDESIDNLGTAFRLLVHLLFSDVPGQPTTYGQLGQELKKDKKTIEKWVGILSKNGFLSHKRVGNGILISLAPRYLTIASTSDRMPEKTEANPNAENPRYQALVRCFEASEISANKLRIEVVI